MVARRVQIILHRVIEQLAVERNPGEYPARPSRDKSRVNEMDVEPADLGDELRPAPVVVGSPSPWTNAGFATLRHPVGGTGAICVRRGKAALSSGCKPRPANRSSRKQPEQSWR